MSVQHENDGVVKSVVGVKPAVVVEVGNDPDLYSQLQIGGISLMARALRKARSYTGGHVFVLPPTSGRAGLGRPPNVPDDWNPRVLRVDETPDARSVLAAVSDCARVLVLSVEHPLDDARPVSPTDFAAAMLRLKEDPGMSLWSLFGGETSARVTDTASLAAAESRLRKLLADRLLASGVVLQAPDQVMLHEDIEVGQGTVVEIGVAILAGSRVGENCILEQGCRLDGTTVGERSRIRAFSVLEKSSVGRDCLIGPFARLRPGCSLGDSVTMGNFVEAKAVDIADRVKAKHLSYLGNATIGSGSNIGAGVITCNYDGQQHHRTVVGRNVFVGSDSQLVAPVQLHDDAYVGAGTTVTRDVPSGALAVGRVRERHVEGWRVGRRNKGRVSSSSTKGHHFWFDRSRLKPVVAHFGDGEVLTERVLDATDGSACNFVDLTVIPPGASIGVHEHDMDNEEHYIIISGQGEMYLAGRKFVVGSGHVIVNPPGGRHGLKNIGSEDLTMVVIEIRVRDECKDNRGTT